ncbi:MAG: alanine--glyoxylate aminotransferase family protein, partial [Acidimicrobiales bacterium]
DPEFIALLDETNARLRTLFDTSNELTFPVSGTGSAGMEAAFVNVIQPDDVAVIAVNGVFGMRMCDVAHRCGANVIAVETEWGKPVDAEQLLSVHPSPAVIGIVHAETSTGVRSDIAALADRHENTLLVLDCVTSLGGMPVKLDNWNVDLAYSGTQKCLGVAPGLSPFSVSPRAVERIVEVPQSWYLDLNMIAKYTSGSGARAYHHTAPISMIFSLHGALGRILNEGMENAFERHASSAQMLRTGLEDLGLELFAEAGSRLNSLTSVWVPKDRLPPDTNEADVRALLL